MSDTHKKPGPLPQFKAYPALLRPDQIEELRRAGPRKGNAFLRDLLDFGLAHPTLFFGWLTTRGEITANHQEQTQ